MSNKFDGFSQDEIKKVSGGSSSRSNQGQQVADASKYYLFVCSNTVYVRICKYIHIQFS